ncbi:MAG: hypothetical protein ABI380_10705 [Edaphobacter sp.]
MKARFGYALLAGSVRPGKRLIESAFTKLFWRRKTQIAFGLSAVDVINGVGQVACAVDAKATDFTDCTDLFRKESQVYGDWGRSRLTRGVNLAHVKPLTPPFFLWLLVTQCAFVFRMPRRNSAAAGSPLGQRFQLR